MLLSRGIFGVPQFPQEGMFFLLAGLFLVISGVRTVIREQ